MTTNRIQNQFLNESTASNLMDYQIEKINRQIQDFIDTNKEVSEYHFEVCPKCGKVHPHLIKAGFANSGKQMLQCKDCKKRFVVDHGQLSFYSHQSQDKWNELIIHTIQGDSLLKTAAEMNVNEMTVFRMRHKFMNFLKEEQVPICIK